MADTTTPKAIVTIKLEVDLPDIHDFRDNWENYAQDLIQFASIQEAFIVIPPHTEEVREDLAKF